MTKRRQRLNVILVSSSEAQREAWIQEFSDLPNVSVQAGNILDLEVDAIVSPSNALLRDDGGLDEAISRKMGPGLKMHAVNKMKKYHNGRLLVGQAMCVDASKKNKRQGVKNVIYAPTMSSTRTLELASENVFLATRGVLLLDREFALSRNSKKPTLYTIAFPALGTGAGGLSPVACARQMRRAFADVGQCSAK